MASNLTNIDGTFITNSLVSVFNNHLKIILEDIATDHTQLDAELLLKKYCLSNLDLDNLNVLSKRKKRKKNKILESTELCMAQKADGLQCTRRRKDNCEYCGKHVNNLKFGRIDDELKYNDKSKYIKTNHERINGTDYLVDENSIVYSFDKDNPKALGTKIDGQLVYADQALSMGVALLT